MLCQKGLRLLLACSAIALFNSVKTLAATTYYIDASTGKDANSGTNPALAWSSLSNVNQHKFSPGDQILFHAGQSWTGTLTPHGNGTADLPITISSYGDGAKPLIQGGAQTRPSCSATSATGPFEGWL